MFLSKTAEAIVFSCEDIMSWCYTSHPLSLLGKYGTPLPIVEQSQDSFTFWKIHTVENLKLQKHLLFCLKKLQS